MGIASHELKTTVTSLKGSIQILQRMSDKKLPPDQLGNFIEKAARQTDKLTVLLDDLLDVTKIQAGKLQLNYTRFDACQMVKESVDEVRAQGGSHELFFHDGYGVEITADRPRLEQVVNNFLTNAIKYSPEAKKVEINCYADADNFTVEVKDFGIGIPPNKRDYLFDRFYRVQKSSAHFSGLGLGLYISAEIVKRHQGTIGMKGNDGPGSTFWFQVPVKP